jgi:hypothetical protein
VATRRIVIVDLNNFAHYPTISVGLFAAVLRQHGHSVHVLSPLSVGVTGFKRAGRTGRFGHLDAMVRFATAWSQSAIVRSIRRSAASFERPDTKPNEQRVVDLFRDFIATRPSVVLVSAYTMYARVVEGIALECQRAQIPLLVGGSYLNEKLVSREWLRFPGITAIVAAERGFDRLGNACELGASLPTLITSWVTIRWCSVSTATCTL